MIIDKYLNKITMYRLTLYYLIVLVGIASITGFFGITQYPALDVFYSSAAVILACYLSNLAFAKIFRATTNTESVFITGLIILLIFPLEFPQQSIALVVVSFLAMGSKYLLTIEKRHVFNPAAVAVVMISLLSSAHAATWWVGTPALFIPVVIGGLLLVRKIQRGKMVAVFLFTYLILNALAAVLHNNSIISIWQRSFSSSAALFFAFVMLAEPLTSPSTQKMRGIYAVIVAVLYSTPILRLGGMVFTPEMALIGGNIFSYIINPKYRLSLPLLRKIMVSRDTFVFEFPKVMDFKFIPGQYLEWTLQHNGTDARGNRRYFSIASAPHENLMMAVKFYHPSSSYKRALFDLLPSEKIIATSLSGDFVMPKDRKTPLVFIAGGVGIAPFRSILEDIIEKRETVDIVVLFANKKAEDIIFKETLERARSFGVRTQYILTDKNSLPENWNGLVGHVTPEIIKNVLPDLERRKFYVSGPQLMVQNFEKVLHEAGVKSRNIKADFFPGYRETTV